MSGPGLELGTFSVGATIAQAGAFRRATGQPDGGTALPLTFPLCWLSGGDLRVALVALVGHEPVVLVHESQAFSYTRALLVGQPYVLTLTVRREHAPERLVLDGAVADADGGPCARLETILRLVAVPESA